MSICIPILLSTSEPSEPSDANLGINTECQRRSISQEHRSALSLLPRWFPSKTATCTKPPQNPVFLWPLHPFLFPSPSAISRTMTFPPPRPSTAPLPSSPSLIAKPIHLPSLLNPKDATLPPHSEL